MKRFLLIAALAAAAMGAAAYDLTGSGFSKSGERDEDGKTFAVLADEAGGELLFCAEAEPDAERLSALKSLYEAVRAWPGFEAQAIRAVNYADRLQLVAIPSRFEVDGQDLVQAVPSGVQLFRSAAPQAATEYDFKVKSGQSVLRVRSVYTGWDELSAAALAAYRDPAAYIQARDPLYALKRFAEIEAKVDSLDELLLGSATKADETNLQSKSGNEALGSRVADIQGGMSNLEKRLKDIDARIAELQAAQARTEAGAMAALNGGLAIDEASVAKLAEMKAAKPDLDKKAAAAELKAAGVKMSAKEIAAVFLVKFGER
jgi:hypothetical protein